LVLPETKMVDHKKLTEDLQFDMLIQSLVVGLSCGIVMMYKADCVQLDEVSTTPQGIHAIVKASRWVVFKENRLSFLNDAWIPNHLALRDMIEGPLTLNDTATNVDTIYNSGNWDTPSISINLHENITNL
ncbi:hypothetical protein A4A49_65283, partial [Nicotiana attenuata]